MMNSFPVACVLITFLVRVIRGFPDVAPLSVKNVESEIFTSFAGPGVCHRSLNVNGEVGCAGKQSGPMQLLSSADEPMDESRVVLVQASLAAAFLEQYLADATLQQSVKGVLIDGRGKPASFSMGGKFPSLGVPNASFPYEHGAHEWNPSGTGLRFKNLNIPVFLVTGDLAEELTTRATINARKGFSGPTHFVELESTMLGTTNSGGCLEKRTCDMIGGHSVLAALPTESESSKPILLITAQMDTAGLFLDKAVGADSSVSGLIALLVAADLLSKEAGLEEGAYRVVFAVTTGEAWGYMGTKRLIWELGEGKGSSGAALPVDIDITKIEKLIEVGPVGLSGRGKGKPQLYVHQQADAKFGDTGELLAALEDAAGSVVSLTAASSSNPGIPPSSLMVWLSRRPDIQGVVLAEFDTQYINPYFESFMDDEDNADTESIAAAGLVLAKAIYKLSANGSANELTSANAQNSSALLSDCLLKSDPSLECSLAGELMSVKPADCSVTLELNLKCKDTTALSAPVLPEHYAGIIRYLNNRPQDADPRVTDNLERFIFNYLAKRVAREGGAKEGCNLVEQRCSEGQVCVGYKFRVSGDSGLGTCLDASAAFVASYPLAWVCTNCTMEDIAKGAARRWQRLSGEDAAALAQFVGEVGWSAEAVWTESQWPSEPTPTFRVFLRESKGTEVGIVVAGLVLFVVSMLVAMASRSVFEKRIKQS